MGNFFKVGRLENRLHVRSFEGDLFTSFGSFCLGILGFERFLFSCFCGPYLSLSVGLTKYTVLVHLTHRQ